MTDFRALCTELVEAWDSYSYVDAGDAADRMAEAVKAARAALAAAPEVEPPSWCETDPEQRAWQAGWEARDDVMLRRAALPPNYIDPEYQGEDLELLQTFYAACRAEGGTADEIHLRGLRAVLAARPAAPLEGEVAELMEWLRRQAAKWQAIDRAAGLTRSLVAEHFTRAAALLSIAYATGEESWEPVAQLPAQRHPAAPRGGSVMNRDQHLPSPDVADWLLDQEWSKVIPVTAITYPKGHPDGLTQSERFDYCETTVAIGANECCHLTLPVEALEDLKSDRQARLDAIEQKRATLMSDELERKRERDIKRMDEVPCRCPLPAAEAQP